MLITLGVGGEQTVWRHGSAAELTLPTPFNSRLPSPHLSDGRECYQKRMEIFHDLIF